jgi:hypothetical protein
MFVLSVSPAYLQRLSYEQYWSKLPFTFHQEHSEIFWFCFFFSFFKAKSQRFCGLHKNTQTLRLSPKSVLFIGFVVTSHFPNAQTL